MKEMFELVQLERRLIEIGCASEEGLSYVRIHYRRYIETLKLIKEKDTDKLKILELGGCYPYAFTLMLKAAFPHAGIVLGQYDGTPIERAVTLSNSKTGETFSLESKSFNIETDHWPFRDDYFDVVLCMEILEHLVLDPSFAFREAHRVLHPGGELIVTTPNIASYESLFKLINLQTPYRYGLYSRQGAYGRHNREYVPMEVKRIGECNGFSTAVLTTKDIYENPQNISVPPRSLKKRLAESLLRRDLGATQMRGQNIFYIGIKEERPFLPYPQDLFDFDPDIYAAKIEIIELLNCVEHNKIIGGKVRLHNYGRYIWQNTGNDITRLGIQLLDNQGRLLSLDFDRVDLHMPLHPGESMEIDFTIASVPDPGEYVLRFDMVRERRCWFSDINRIFVDRQIRII